MEYNATPIDQPRSGVVHEAEEWEAIRPLLTKLYKDDDKKLREIRQTFAQRGFHASERQYKRRIRLWNLDKNNKESDMVFAAKKIAHRRAHGKETVFEVRGRNKTSHEVTRYWGRRKDHPDDASPVPSTPPDIRYWTPSPAPFEGSTSLVSSPVHDITGNGIVQSFFTQTFQPPSTVPPRLTSPGHLRDLELILPATRAYYEMCIQATHEKGIEQLATSDGKAGDFLDYVSATIYHAKLGFHASAGMAFIRAVSIVPEILKDQHVDFVAHLMDIIRFFCQYDLLDWLRELMQSVVQQTIITCSATHPLVLILQAMWRSFEMNGYLAEVLLRSGVDLLSKRIGSEHEYTNNAAAAMISSQLAGQDYYGVLKYCDYMYKSHKDRIVLSSQEGRWLVKWHGNLVYCHLRLRNYDAATRLIEELSGICGRYEEQGQVWRVLRCSYLIRLRQLRYCAGLPGAVEAAEEALAFARRDCGDESVPALRAACSLNDIVAASSEG